MKIILDIGHPAHVHYFKYFIRILEGNGHEFLIVARDKEISHTLLKKYGFDFKSRGKGGFGILGKLFYLFKGSAKLIKHSRSFKPDLLVSFASPYAAITSFLIRKPHIAFDDTEHAKFEQVIFLPFTKTVLTPACFYKDFGKKHIRFNGFMELCYLHKNWYRPNPEVLNSLGLKPGEKYIVVRFVSWNASHDLGYHGFDKESKISVITELAKHCKLFISSEGRLPDELAHYKLNLSPECMHDVLYYSSLFLGEGGTMASECAILGIPSIYVNNLPLMGYLKEEQNAGLVYHFQGSEGVVKKAIEFLSIDKKMWQYKQDNLLDGKIDLTSFMAWFIENYPASHNIMRDHSEYQDRFNKMF